jgi:RNA polymerase sigma-70 factor (ECF subfamily)
MRVFDMDDGAGRIAGLYEQHAPAILRYLRRWVGPADTAEDLLQETFVQALRRPQSLAEASSPRGWLFGIARNLANNLLRRRRNTGELPSGVPGPAESPEDPRLARVRDLIARLPGPQREALQLRLTDGLSYEEIAQAMQIPIGTVRSRLHNAVERLREGLADAEE